MTDQINVKENVQSLKIEYYRAARCWRSNNLKSCLRICDNASKKLSRLISSSDFDTLPNELLQLKHLLWFLKIRCLADDYYVNESLLLNEDDIENDNQVRIFSGTRRSTTTRTITACSSMDTREVVSRKFTGAGGNTRHRTGVITGRMPSVASRQSSSRTISSYRPLTTSLTATQTAFSRATRPLLKYSTSHLLSKLVFEYLYNAQKVTNKCPDYRQCLEYLNLVQNTIRKKQSKLKEQKTRLKSDHHNQVSKLLETSDESDERKSLGIFWLTSFGTCYYNLRMSKQAEEYFSLARIVNPKYMDSYAWLVKIYLRSNQSSKVLQICEEGLKQSKNAVLYNWLARVQSLNNDLYIANSNLRDSLKYFPTNIEALANVGHFAFYGDKLEQSLKCFERIQQLSLNQSTVSDDNMTKGSSAELLNNLALCNFYCGFYHKVMPLFLKALMNSPSKEVTSDIWFNISFIPISFGFKNLAIACLRLALKNNSQNEEAMNNIGALKCGNLVDESLHFENRQELWPTLSQKSTLASELELKNFDDQSTQQAAFDEAETYFGSTSVGSNSLSQEAGRSALGAVANQPEMLYNMALIKKARGQLLASVNYCNMYLDHDPGNYHIQNKLKEIMYIVS